MNFEILTLNYVDYYDDGIISDAKVCKKYEKYKFYVKSLDLILFFSNFAKKDNKRW